MKRVLRIVTHPIILAVGFLAVLMIVWVNINCFVGGSGVWGCPDPGAEGAMVTEQELVQAAMYAMMADKSITTVTPNDDTNNSLGVNTWTDLPEGPDTASLYAYIKKTTTQYYYCWDSKGIVYAQNKTDGVRAAPDDAKNQRLCKKTPGP